MTGIVPITLRETDMIMRKESPLSNRLLVNRYQLLELVGRGAMGQVYRAEDTLLGGITVAIKLLSRSLLDQKMLQKFEREASISAILSEKSINIVKVRDYGLDENGVPFYVMEFLEGAVLADIIRVHSFSLERFLSIARQMCTAMEFAHNGIIFEGELCPILHRDIKPSNVFVTEDNSLGELIKILDFGIADFMHSLNADKQSFTGTLEYCSPEQIQGKKLDNRSDIYSLGVVMYEMLTKELPLKPKNTSFESWYQAHSEFAPKPFASELNLPLNVKSLVLSCLAKSPLERPQNLGEILQTLETLEKKYAKKVVNATEEPSYKSSFVSLEEILLQNSWPRDKPLQKIVFPCLINSTQGVLPTLWVMLEETDMLNSMSSIRYSEFIFQSFPHPMILWLTVLHNSEQGTRWLPCYLDLKIDIGIQVTNILAEAKSYYILLFALNKSRRCQGVIRSKLILKQRTLLKKWSGVAAALKNTNEAAISKKKLRTDLEELKPEIIKKLEEASTDELYG
jgi:serine/threonine-protein kinase